jgi:glycosyltransferase involved in cell wall biosynthesis
MDEVKNILYLSYDGMTDPLGQSQVLPYIVGLSQKGFRFHLISFEKPDRYEKLKGDIQKICDKNNISWHPRIYTKKPPLLSTIYDVWRMRNLTFQLHRKNKFSIIHCRSYLSAMVGLTMKKKFKTKFLFDMRGFWADERVDGKIWNLKNPVFKIVYNFFKQKEKEFFLNADHIISLTDNGKKEITSWKGFEHLSTQIEVIPCCADLELFKPYERDSEDFVLGYLGSLGTWYMLYEMLVVYQNILVEIPNARFHFLTKDNPEIIFDEARKLNIEKSNFVIEECVRQDIPYKTRNWNYSIFFILPSYSKKSSSPTKQGELMGMGIPIICNKGVGDVDKIVLEMQSGIILESVNNIDLKLSKYNFKKEILHQKAHEIFSLKDGVETFSVVYKKIMN